ncbi:MAG: hypothetical protein V2G42_07550 [bacterium JZ-2024 1]
MRSRKVLVFTVRTGRVPILLPVLESTANSGEAGSETFGESPRHNPKLLYSFLGAVLSSGFGLRRIARLRTK